MDRSPFSAVVYHSGTRCQFQFQYRGIDNMRSRVIAALAVATILPAACDSLPLAMGDVNSIIVTTAPELWAEIEAPLVPSLERTVFTVRDEKIFKVTHQAPDDEDWYRLRLLKQQLVIGTVGDAWMADALAKVDEPVTPPQIVQVHDVWARDQLVTVVVLGDAGDAEGVLGLTPSLAGLFDRQFRAWAVARMFVTGRDTALARTLREEHRFSLLVPGVYDYELRDSVHIFRNDNPDPSELIRQFAITWQSPIPPELTGEDLLDWRARIVEDYYDFPQVVNTEQWIAGPETWMGNQAYTIQAVWENPPERFPAAGPFITRAVVCLDQQRMYLIDAWLYAPSRDKYEYMIQLEEILNSFHCTGL